MSAQEPREQAGQGTASVFLRHVLVLMTGTAFAQAIPVFIYPVLTRLYTPEDFGLLTAFIGMAVVVAVLGTLNYEFAIVLPKTDGKARAVVGLAARLLTCWCLFCAFLSFPVVDSVAILAGRPGEVYWIYALVPMAAIIGVFQITSHIATRNRQFYAIARAMVSQQAGFSLFAVLLGMVFKMSSGLIAARLLGSLIGALTLAGMMALNWRPGPRTEGYRAIARRYWRFPVYNCPYSLIGSFGKEFFVLALVGVSQLAAAGFYGLARNVVFVPVSFLSASLGNIYYKEATISLHTPRLELLTVQVSRTIATVFTPIFAVIPIIGPSLFAWLFGPEWRTAGVYAGWLTLPAFLAIFSSWPGRIYEVAEKQHLSFLIQVTFDVLSISAVLLMLSHDFSPLQIIPALTVLTGLFYLSYIVTAFRIAAFRWEVFAPVILRIIILAMFWMGLAVSARLAFQDDATAMLCIVAFLTAYLTWIGLVQGRMLLSGAGVIR